MSWTSVYKYTSVSGDNGLLTQPCFHFLIKNNDPCGLPFGQTGYPYKQTKFRIDYTTKISSLICTDMQLSHDWDNRRFLKKKKKTQKSKENTDYYQVIGLVIFFLYKTEDYLVIMGSVAFTFQITRENIHNNYMPSLPHLLLAECASINRTTQNLQDWITRPGSILDLTSTQNNIQFIKFSFQRSVKGGAGSFHKTLCSPVKK